MEIFFQKLGSIQFGALSACFCIIILCLWSVARAAYQDIKDERNELLRRTSSFNIHRGVPLFEFLQNPIISKFMGIALRLDIKRDKVICTNPKMHCFVYTFTLPVELNGKSFLEFMNEINDNSPYDWDYTRIDAFIQVIKYAAEEFPEFVNIKYEELEFYKAISKIFGIPFIQ